MLIHCPHIDGIRICDDCTKAAMQSYAEMKANECPRCGDPYTPTPPLYDRHCHACTIEENLR